MELRIFTPGLEKNLFFPQNKNLFPTKSLQEKSFVVKVKLPGGLEI